MRAPGKLKLFIGLFTCALIAYWPNSLSAQEPKLYLIAHSDIGLSFDEVRDIYFGSKEFCGQVRALPVDNESARAEFLTKVMGVDRRRYDNIWIKKSFRDAREPPAIKQNDRDVMAFVAANSGAIGYVRTPPADGVVVLGGF